MNVCRTTGWRPAQLRGGMLVRPAIEPRLRRVGSMPGNLVEAGVRATVHQDRQRASSAAAYFVVQGVATLAWWALIAWSPAWRRWFAFGDDGASLWMFLPTDMLFWSAGSVAVAVGTWRRARWATPTACALCGAIAASVLHAATLAAEARAGWPGVLLMTPALVLTLFFTWHSTRDT